VSRDETRLLKDLTLCENGLEHVCKSMRAEFVVELGSRRMFNSLDMTAIDPDVPSTDDVEERNYEKN